MSVLGIDIGTSYCVLATIQRGAVAIVRNELSERLTPALVSFTDKERLIGEAAQTQIRSNFMHTARNIKQLLGCTRANTDDFSKESMYSLASLDFTPDTEGGLVGYRIQYKGNECIMSATRCMAALLTKLKKIGEKSMGSPVHDVVINVPGWFSEASRQAMIDAAEIAGLNCLRLMNEHAAVALDYGIYRSNTFDPEKASRVAFVGIGHGAANVFVADYIKGELRMHAVGSDKTIGGRDFDREIIIYFAKQFQDKHKIDPLKNAKAVLKLEEAATKAKKIVSANSEAPFNIECLIDDFDIHGLLTRRLFEDLCEPFRQRLIELLKNTFETNGIAPDSIHHIEIVGGCTRIPWVQDTITNFFNNRLPLSKTLNMDETVARGCALQAAMLNPRYRVREFTVVDRLFEPVTVSWIVGDGKKTSILFEAGSALGMKKWLTFQRHSGFEVCLTSGFKGQPLISFIDPPHDIAIDSNLPRKIKIKARLSLDSIVSWEAAQLLIDEEVEEIVKEKRTIDETMSESKTEEGGENGESKVAEQKFDEVDVVKKKIKTHRFDCTIQSSSRLGYLSREVKLKYRESEIAMTLDDHQQQATKESMNDLESYIYHMRDKLQGVLCDFASSTEKEVLGSKLIEAENWVYNNPEGTVDVYTSKLNELKALGDPIEDREAERLKRMEATQDLSNTLSLLRASMNSTEFLHVDEAKMQSLATKISDMEKWMQHSIAQIDSAPLHQMPKVKAKDFTSESEMLKNFAKTILVVKPAEQKSPAEKKPPAEQNPACDTVPESPDKNDISMDGTSSTSFEDSTIAQEIDVSM